MSGPLVSINPTTGAEVWRGSSASAQECQEAMSRAHSRFGAWSAMSADDRCRIALAFAAAVRARTTELASAVNDTRTRPV